MAFNPMDFFQAGGQLGQANASPFSYGASNVMNMFNQANKLGMMMNMQKGLQENEQQMLNKYEPQRKGMELTAELGARKQYMKGMFSDLGILNGGGGQGGDASASPDASKPLQGGSPKGATVGKNGLMLKSINPMTGEMQMGNTAYDTQVETAKKAGSDLQNLENLKDQSLNIISNGIGNFKQMTQSNPIANKIGAGRIAGIGNVFGRMTGTNPGAAPYESSKTEIATELAKIANPSGRPGPDMIQMYSKLLPDDFSNPQEASNKFANAIHNALARYHGAKQAMETQRGIQPTPYSRAEYDPQVQSILNAPASSQLNMNNPLQQVSQSGNQDTPQSRLEAKLKQRGWL